MGEGTTRRAGLFEYVMTDDARLSMLLAQSRAQTERAQAELAVTLGRVPRSLILGETMQALLEQIRRLRANPCPTMKFGFEPADLREAIRDELVEVECEAEGSDRAQAESLDVVVAALHHAIAQGADILDGLDDVARKLERRLDARQRRDLTWEQAKAEEGASSPRPADLA